ncbi:Iron-regulated ABC transporter ATPase subunit SufC [Ruminococcaceae bacterium YRB3002]|nr:Iron-regulated ABC transporter ATPase subunit SufC [Ruminococcaceae bacterium YRB3002]
MLEVQNVSYSVTEDGVTRKILDDVSLTIPDSKLTVITGPNGGGKSTLARIIAGVLTPDSGRILFDGQDITDMSVTDRARIGIGFAFQQPVRFKGIKVIDLLRLAKDTKKLSSADACKYLAAVGLCAKDYIDREVNASLSGGELKRIEIATVLIKQSKLSLFDEPEAGIDLWSFQNLIEVFDGMRKHIEGSSIIIISHQERILKIADEILLIKDGKLAARGEADEIMPMLMANESVVKNCNLTDIWKGGAEC